MKFNLNDLLVEKTIAHAPNIQFNNRLLEALLKSRCMNGGQADLDGNRSVRILPMDDFSILVEPRQPAAVSMINLDVQDLEPLNQAFGYDIKKVLTSFSVHCRNWHG